MAVLFAATYPERTEGLIIYGSYARRLFSEDYPWGKTPEARAAYAAQVESEWGWEADMQTMCPSADKALALWWGERSRAAASPGAARALIEMNLLRRYSAVLPAVRRVSSFTAATTAICKLKRGNALHRQPHRWGDLHRTRRTRSFCSYRRRSDFLDPVEAFLTGHRSAPAANRLLATIFFVDIVDSTRKAIGLGDRKWVARAKRLLRRGRRAVELDNRPSCQHNW